MQHFGEVSEGTIYIKDKKTGKFTVKISAPEEQFTSFLVNHLENKLYSLSQNGIK